MKDAKKNINNMKVKTMNTEKINKELSENIDKRNSNYNYFLWKM